MAHKTLVNGTGCDVQGGKCLVGGTAYNILKGRTLIGGTGYDIAFTEPLIMPVKGDLITMNLDGEDRQYKVLKVINETTVEAMTSWCITTLSFSRDSSTVYENSSLDKYLNNQWYGSLSAQRAAIIPKNQVIQFGYNGGNGYDEDTYASNANYSSKTVVSTTGARYVYALDIEDIEVYFGGTGGTARDKTPGTYGKWDLADLFGSSLEEDVALRSRMNESYLWDISSFRNSIYGYISPSKENGVVAAFQIDLSKIDFTIN